MNTKINTVLIIGLTIIFVLLTIAFALLAAPIIANAEEGNTPAYTYNLPLVINQPAGNLIPYCSNPVTDVSVSGSELFVDVTVNCHGGTYSGALDPQVDIMSQSVNWITIGLCVPGGLCQIGEHAPGPQMGDYVMISDYNQDTINTDFTLWYDEIYPSYDYAPAVVIEDTILYEDGSMVIIMCIEAFSDTCQ